MFFGKPRKSHTYDAGNQILVQWVSLLFDAPTLNYQHQGPPTLVGDAQVDRVRRGGMSHETTHALCDVQSRVASQHASKFILFFISMREMRGSAGVCDPGDTRTDVWSKEPNKILNERDRLECGSLHKFTHCIGL